MLRKLINLLPVSRRTINNMALVIEGLVEAEANHCQIEMNIIQQMQQGKRKKTTEASNDPAFM